MTKKFRNKKAQAMIEMAILGPLLLVALGIVATYVAKLNNDHWVLMQAFRNALAKAHDTNEIVSYGTWDDRRMVSVTNPIIGEKTTSSGSACVHWSIPSVANEGSDGSACVHWSIPSVANEGSDSTDRTYVKINGGWIPFLKEYDLGSGQGGGIEAMYITTRGSKVEINTQNNYTTSRRSAGVGEFMLYKVGKKRFIQGRGHGASRSFSAGTPDFQEPVEPEEE